VAKLAPEWRDLLALLPAYDSEATAAPADYFDAEAAQLALDFFPECLQFIEGERAGEPFQIEPWQQAIVAALWGWRREDGTRRYREALIYVPRKNGKTPFCAGLVLLSMFTDGEPGAQLYSAAADRDQAAIIFKHAAGMLAREPALASRAKIYRSFKSIEYPAQGAVYKALSSDAETKHGLGASLVIVDELHAHRDGELVEVLLTSTGARRSPLTIYITTADFERPSICNRTHTYASGVRDGAIQDRSFLPVIYEAGPDDDWTDPAVWSRTNPNLNVSIKLEYFERLCERAKAEPSYENTFKRLHLNIRTGQDVRWLPVEAWEACRQELPDLIGRECYAGLDLSTTTDISAFVLAFPGAPLWIVPHFWIPESKLKNRADRVPYRVWERAGLLTVTPGDVVDYDAIRAGIVELGQKYSIQEIRFDPWNATQLATQLAEQEGFELTQMRQGFVSMNAPTKELERKILGRTLAHGGHPVLSWMIGNVAVKMDPAGNIKPDKSKSSERIDGVVAAIMALSGCMAASEPADMRIMAL
jgi:phage terminase large subunit-like protein